MLEIVRKAADRIGGVPRLAERIGVTRQAIYQWREVPADRVVEMAAATGVSRAAFRPDLFGGSDEDRWRLDALDDAAPADWTALRQDGLAWLDAQADALAAGSAAEVDADRLVELLRSLSLDARADVERRLQVIVVRLLKWRHRPERRSLSTVGVITAERARVFARLAASPSLKEHAIASLPAVFMRAVRQTADETGLAHDIFPADCPYSLDELLDPAFAPKANAA